MNAQALQLRQKKIGVLMLDARRSVRWKPSDCAEVLGISTEAYQAFEAGTASPSLPQLELLAYKLRVPLAHFWGDTALTSKSNGAAAKKAEQVLALRHRIVGTLLRKARTEQNLSLQDLADQVGIGAEDLELYEFGKKQLSLPELEHLTRILGRSIQEFYDSHGPVGSWVREQQVIEQFSELPAELQEFVSKPVNRPYLELAARLSQMSVDKLRGVAEGLLEITL
jgi:transcriptional regulator with XRE-family HTH domain